MSYARTVEGPGTSVKGQHQKLHTGLSVSSNNLGSTVLLMVLPAVESFQRCTIHLTYLLYDKHVHARHA